MGGRAGGSLRLSRSTGSCGTVVLLSLRKLSAAGGRRSRRKGPCSPVFCGAAFGGGCFAVRLPGIDRLLREERPLRHVRHTATLPASLFAGACAPLASRAVRPLLPMPVAGVPSTFSDGIQQSSGVGLYPPAFQLFEFGQNHSVQQPEEECGLSRTQILD